MPYRKSPIGNDEIYHVFNRSVAQQPIFISKYDYKRAIDLIDFYRFEDTNIRFSFYNRMKYQQKGDFMYSLYSTSKLVEIYSFCLMPDHFHFLLKQLTEGGIAKFLRIFQNSYAKYLNTKTERHGAAFQAMFKAVRIESNNQLLHVFRYINLNPVTSYLLKNIEELKQYPWSSFCDYFTKNPPHQFVETGLINEQFLNKNKLEEFVKDQVNYQRTLNQIKHLTFE